MASTLRPIPCFILAIALYQVAAGNNQHEFMQGAYYIRNLYGCTGQPQPVSYSSHCGNYVYLKIGDNLKFVADRPRRSDVRGAWELVPVRDEKDVYYIRTVGCQLSEDVDCLYWSYQDQNFRWVDAYSEEDKVQWEITPRGAEGGYRIRTKYNCDEKGRPWPCDVELTWTTVFTANLWLDEGSTVNFAIVPTYIEP